MEGETEDDGDDDDDNDDRAHNANNNDDRMTRTKTFACLLYDVALIKQPSHLWASSRSRTGTIVPATLVMEIGACATFVITFVLSSLMGKICQK